MPNLASVHLGAPGPYGATLVAEGDLDFRAAARKDTDTPRDYPEADADVENSPGCGPGFPEPRKQFPDSRGDFTQPAGTLTPKPCKSSVDSSGGIVLFHN